MTDTKDAELGSSIHSRIAGRRLRVGVFNSREQKIIAKRLFESGADVRIGADATEGLVVPGWTGETLLLISRGHLLHLGPGMRLHMCHDEGEDRVIGEFDELVASGVVSPIPINVSKLNIRVREGISVFATYLTDDQPPWPDSGDWKDPG
jgi:hypothetical protein